MTDLNDPKNIRAFLARFRGSATYVDNLRPLLIAFLERLEALELKTGFTVNREGEQVAQGPQMPLRGGPGALDPTKTKCTIFSNGEADGSGMSGSDGSYVDGQLRVTANPAGGGGAGQIPPGGPRYIFEDGDPCHQKAVFEQHAREVRSQTDAVTAALQGTTPDPDQTAKERLRQEEACAEAGYKTAEQINQTPVQFLHAKREIARLKADVLAKDKALATKDQLIARLKADVLAKDKALTEKRARHKEEAAAWAESKRALEQALANYKVAAESRRPAQDRAQAMFTGKDWARLGEDYLIIALDRIQALEKGWERRKGLIRRLLEEEGAEGFSESLKQEIYKEISRD